MRVSKHIYTSLQLGILFAMLAAFILVLPASAEIDRVSPKNVRIYVGDSTYVNVSVVTDGQETCVRASNVPSGVSVSFLAGANCGSNNYNPRMSISVAYGTAPGKYTVDIEEYKKGSSGTKDTYQIILNIEPASAKPTSDKATPLPTYTPTPPPTPVPPTPSGPTEPPPSPSPEPLKFMPQSIGLDFCVEADCASFAVPITCQEDGTCRGATTIPAADCGAETDCEATVVLTCVPTTNNSSQCDGTLEVAPCDGTPVCSSPLSMVCGKTDCAAKATINLPTPQAPSPTPPPTATPTPEPSGLLSSITSAPWLVLVICLLGILGGLAIGLLVYWRMSQRGGEEEEEEEDVLTSQPPEA